VRVRRGLVKLDGSYVKSPTEWCPKHLIRPLSEAPFFVASFYFASAAGNDS